MEVVEVGEKGDGDAPSSWSMTCASSPAKPVKGWYLAAMACRSASCFFAAPGQSKRGELALRMASSQSFVWLLRREVRDGRMQCLDPRLAASVLRIADERGSGEV